MAPYEELADEQRAMYKQLVHDLLNNLSAITGSCQLFARDQKPERIERIEARLTKLQALIAKAETNLQKNDSSNSESATDPTNDVP